MRKFCNIKLTFKVATKIVAATPDVTDVLLPDRVDRKNSIQNTRRSILWQIIVHAGLILIRSRVEGKTI